MTFDDYATSIRQAVFPDGEAENLIAKHNDQIADALCDLQRAVKCLSEGNQTRWRQHQTRYIGGTSAVEAPDGVVTKVMSVRSGDANDLFTYDRVTPADFHSIVSKKPCNTDAPRDDLHPMAMTRVSLAGGAAAPMDIAAYPAGREEQNRSCRSEGGIWTIKRSDLHVWPSINSNEMLVAFWDGVVSEWTDSTDVNSKFLNRQVKRAVELYLEAESSRFETESLKDFQATAGLYAEQRKELILWCRRQKMGEFGSEEA